MPVYRCSAPVGSVPAEARTRIAREFTRIHSRLTGAPPSFVHVHFVDVDQAIGDGLAFEIHGTVRAGRSGRITSQLVEQLTAAFSRIADVAPGAVVVRVDEIAASWIMEGGEVAPEPGAEAQWLERHEGRA